MDEQRYSRAVFARGMLSAMRGEESIESIAFARNVCEVMTIHANSLTDNKWGG